MKKRMMSFLLAAVMLVSLLPTEVYAADLRELMNSAPLQPVRSELYGERVDEILAECGYGEEDTYTVFKNCYDWLVTHVRYRTNSDVTDSRSLTFSVEMDQDAIDARAYAPFYQGVGVCDEYAGALFVLAQSIGLKPYYFRGETRRSSGGYVEHAWMGVELDGEIYMFDSQVEDDVAKGGEIRYYYFGKTLEELGGSHIPNEELFERFKKESGYADMEEETARTAEEEDSEEAEEVEEESEEEEAEEEESQRRKQESREEEEISEKIEEEWEDSSEKIRIMVNGRRLLLEQPPVIVEGRTLVPMRAIFEALGASVSWDQNTQMILSERDDLLVILQLNSTQMYHNGTAVTLDVPAMMINERTMVPTRAVAAAFGCDVVWKERERTVEIREKNV